MNDSLWVDPERLGRSGAGYFDAQQELEGVSQEARDITLRYYNSIGNDEEGQKFRAVLEQGLQQYHNGIDMLSAAMNYVGEGLRSNGELYGRARDSADEATFGLETGMEQGAAALGANRPPGQQESEVLAEPLKRRVEPMEQGVRLRAPMAPLVGQEAEVLAEPLKQRLEPMEPAKPAEEPLPNEPANGGTQGQEGGAFIPAHSLGMRGEDGQMKYRLLGMDEIKTVPSNTMTSQMSMQALRSGEQVLAGGEPLPEGYQLIMASELPGGEVRLNVEDYADVVPLTGDVQVANQDDPSQSRDLTEDGMRPFAVKARGEDDPPQQPGLHMAFGEDGRSAYFRYEDE
ncbi:hypothetical protein [Saccharopolyspora sp. CA-218241]|uniref:hypothetical protein n=1 Tax=Saccharopolyspora sp. CA-218241 TaxID=3240027 RepID=UPI003D996E3A